MHQTLKRHTISFKNAFAGLFYAFRSQPTFKVHLFIAFVALFFALFFALSFFEMLIILLLIILVFIVEMINTAIESATDLLTSEYSEKAKIAKDVSAGMVLLTSFAAVIIGLLIFGSHII